MKIPTTDPLYERALHLFPDETQEQLRAKWIEAVLFLRSTTMKGWVLDKIILKTPEKRVL